MKPQFKSFTASLLVLISLIAFNIVLSAQTEAPKTDSTSAKQALVDESIDWDCGSPEYIEGDTRGLVKFIQANLRCPEGGANGVIFINFTISPEGNVLDPVIRRGLSPAANKEVLRVVRLLKFKPLVGCQLNQPMIYRLPIKFSPDCIPHP